MSRLASPTSTSVLARSSQALLEYIKSSSVSSENAVIYSISSNTDPAHLPDLITHFKTAPVSLGCISHPLPSSSHPYSCSFFSVPSSLCIPFRSTLPGKEKTSVGRWHVARAEPPKESAGSSLGISRELLRSREKIAAIITLTDDAPEGLNAFLSSRFPSAPKLGLIAAHTPFITGRPHTLLSNAEVFSSGAVGMALKAAAATPAHRVGFSGLEPISELYSVTSVASNLIHSIDGKNPTNELIDLIRKRGLEVSDTTIIGKDGDFYLSVEDEVSTKSSGRIYRIISGGPSRGTIALDGDGAVSQGSKVRFMYRPPGASVHIPPSADATASVEFITSSIEDTSDTLQQESAGDVVVMDNRFLAASESGFSFGTLSNIRPNRTWRSIVTGSWATLDWPNTRP